MLRLTVLITIMISAGCGKIGLGGGADPDDPVPTGTKVAQGTFSGVNDATVSGFAFVYQTASGYVVRLEDLSVSGTSEPSYRLRAATSASTSAFSTTLRSTAGNQNYSTGLGGSQFFQEVTIESFTSTPAERGRALLTPL